MKALIFTIFTTLYALSSLIPYKSYSTITEVNGNSVKLDNANAITGMSALVVRDLSANEYAISYLKIKSANSAVLIDKDPINGGHLANIKNALKVGDRVISGFLYNKYILLAPNKDSYFNIKDSFALNPISSELFLAYLKSKGKNSASYSDYKEFAKMLGIGLFIIAKDNFLELYDPISEETIKKVPFKFNNSIKIKPFYTNLNN